MRRSRAVQSRWRLLALALLVGALAVVGLGSQSAWAARAVPARALSGVRPFVGCAPCISQVSPTDGATASFDPDGKITISFTAQLDNPFSKFEFTLDGTQVDNTQIQITSTDPMQPTGQYRAALSAGQHQAFVQVIDSTASVVASFGWKFTAPQPPPPTPTPTKAPAGGGSGGGGATADTSSGGFFTPKTLSILLFSIAGLGLLVIVFIAGMWYGGRRALRNEP